MRFSRALCFAVGPSARHLVGSGKVSVVGIPIDLGGNRRGVDMGPSAFHVAGLNDKVRELGYQVEDLGSVYVPTVENVGKAPLPKSRYQKEIASVCTDVAKQVFGAMQRGHFPLSLGGDHSAAIGCVSGTSAFLASRGERIGMIWVDAHTDMNTPDTSPSGNIHGMPMACLLGHGPKELTHILRSEGSLPHLSAENCAFIGIRDVDETELALVHSSGVTVFTMEEVDLLGAREVMRRALLVATRGTAGFHFSFDMDGVDPEVRVFWCVFLLLMSKKVAPGVGTPVTGGLSYREAHLLCEMAASSQRMLAMDVMETNPALDVANKTGSFGVELQNKKKKSMGTCFSDIWWGQKG
jgi:arginase